MRTLRVRIPGHRHMIALGRNRSGIGRACFYFPIVGVHNLARRPVAVLQASDRDVANVVLGVGAISHQQSLRSLCDRRGTAAAYVAIDGLFANLLTGGVNNGAFQRYWIVLAFQRLQPEYGPGTVRVCDHRSQPMLDRTAVAVGLQRRGPVRTIGGRRNEDILGVAIAARRFHPMRKPMSTRQSDYLGHFGWMMEEMSIGRDGDDR